MSDQCDVLVIGSGMGGGAVAKRLSDAGVKVICLEQGGWLDPSVDYSHEYDTWELEKLRGWSYSPNDRQLPEDYPVAGHIRPYLFNAVGGSTVCYGGHWPRYKPVDFRKGTEHGLAGTIDWPITYEELAPFYDINDAEMGISGVPGDSAYPARPNAPRQPTTRPGKLGLRLSEGFDKLGWHWWPSDNSIITEPRDGRQGCNECGACLSGCPRGSLGGTHVSYWPKALRNGVDLRTGARVERIETANGRATGAVYVDLATGERHFVSADIVVLSASGLGTPRLLLMSEQKGFANGLANGNDLVGRHLMHHSYANCDVWFDDPIEGYKASFGAPFYSQEFYDTDPTKPFVNGFTMQVGRSFGAAFTATGSHTREPIGWGSGHHRRFDDDFGNQLLVYVLAEDLPVYDNRVRLDHSSTDSSGLPGLTVDFTPHENDVRLTNYGVERLEEVAFAAGASRVRSTGHQDVNPGWHLMGTARMGNSPEDSTTNKWNQAWEVPNLMIVDGSALTTGAAVNPTPTIGALAVRAAEYIVANGAHIRDQKVTPRNADAPDMDHRKVRIDV
ncbi:MAG: GMC family oxidoreductase [Microbacterium sp.]